MSLDLKWLPNAICMARIVLIVPLVAALIDGRFDWALVLLAIAGGSDALDGYLAKTFGWRTRLGGLLDPAADKLLMSSVFLTLAYLGMMPIVLAAIVIFRDALIVTGAVIYQLLIGAVSGEPTFISKLNTASQLGFLLLVITRAQFAWPPPQYLLLLGAAVVVTTLSSGMHYVVSWSRRASQTRQAAS